MNANASPLRTKDAERVSPDTGLIFLAEKLDSGFDNLVAQHATHTIRDAKLVYGIRDDLAQLMIYPEVTFAACLPDGSMVLCCPQDLPQALVGIAEPIAANPALPPAPGNRRSGLGSKLERLEHKLDDLLATRWEGERLSDRIEALEFTVEEALVGAENSKLSQMLSEIPDQLAKISGPTLEQVLQAVVHLGHRADPSDLLDTLNAKLDGLISRPPYQPDLSLQRLGFANFLTSMSTIVKRLEAAVEEVATPALPPSLDARLLGLERSLVEAAQISPDLGPVIRRLDSLQQEIAPASNLSAQLAHLTQSIDGLTKRPDPVLDLTQQRQSFASFAVALGSAVKRLEAAAQAFEHQPDMTPTLAVLDNLRQQLLAQPTVAAPVASEQPVVDAPHDAVSAQNVDTTELRQGLTGLSGAVQTLITRLEKMETQPAQAAEAIAPPPVPDPAPGPEGFDHQLRYAMAEALALQIRSLSGKG